MIGESESNNAAAEAVQPDGAAARGGNELGSVIDVDESGLTSAEVVLANFGSSPLGAEPLDDIQSVERAFELLGAAMDSPAGRDLAAARRDRLISEDEYRQGILRLMRETEQATQGGSARP